MQSEPPADAARTLAEIDRVRRDTRRTLHPIWFSNLVAGVFFAGAGLIIALDPGQTAALIYWIAGGALALVLIARHYAAVERERGLEPRGWDATTGIVLAMVAGIVLLNTLADAGLYAGAAGLAALGYVLRDKATAWAGAGFAVLATVMLVADPDDPGLWGNLSLGIVLIVAGLAGWAARR